jgi:GAF domain-containing protein
MTDQKSRLEKQRLIEEKRRAESQRDEALQALQQRNRELELLKHIGQALNSTLDLNQVLSTVLEEARRLLEVVAVSVWLVDAESGELVCWQASGPKSEVVRGWRLGPGEGLAGWVVSHEQSLIVPDAMSDARYFKEVGESAGLELRSILSAPMRANESDRGAPGGGFKDRLLRPGRPEAPRIASHRGGRCG